jgi:P pilus assembly chaperone PapD
MGMRRISLMVLILMSAVFLAQGISIRMDPIVVSKTVNPGTSFSYEIFLENDSEFESITLKAMVMDITETEDGAYDLKQPGSTKYSIARWVKVEPDTITVPPKETKTVIVTVNIPRGVSGGLYGAVAFEIQTPQSQETQRPAEEGAYGEIEFKYRMASFLEVVLSGTGQRVVAFPAYFKVERSDDIPSIRMQIGDGALVFTLGVLNKSNAHIVTKGTLTIKTKEGRTIAKMPLGAGRGVVLPDSTVNMRTITRRFFPPGEYVARAVVDYGGRRPIVAETTFTVTSEKVETKEEKEEANPVMITIDPVDIEIKAVPGSYRSEIVKVSNLGEETLQVEGKILPLVYDLYGEILPEEERGTPPEWIKLTPASFSLRPGQSRNVRVAVRIPKDFTGGYYADVIFKTEGGLQTEVGANLLVFAGKDEDITKEASADLVYTVKEDGIYADIVFENTGNYHLLPKITFGLNRITPQQVTDEGLIIPEKVESLIQEEISSTNPVLPGTKRIFSIFIPVVLEEGQYELLARCDYGKAPIVLRKSFQMEGRNGE